ncbi:DUF3568 family protein [Gemmatimonas phototrophica]|nr:DUF3568 family protein [Gemmatimonas phototrophica]
MTRSIRLWATALLAVTTMTSSGCFLLAAGAGAGAAVAYTNRGATANIEGGVNGVFDRAVRTFGIMSITETGRSTEDSGNTRRLVGKMGEHEVTVEIQRQSDNVSTVEVTAKKNVVDYDKEIATRVLETMVK